MAVAKGVFEREQSDLNDEDAPPGVEEKKLTEDQRRFYKSLRQAAGGGDQTKT